MLSAAFFGVLLFHSGSPTAVVVAAPFRRPLMGLAMGLTAVSLIYSTWGRRSGAHFNPAVTLTFYRLGKVPGGDAVFYVLAQCLGGTAGLAMAAWIAHEAVADPSVNYVVTVPGSPGIAAAFLGELTISFGLMSTVLAVSNASRLAPFTGLCAGALVALYITFEAPVSGMSMNPARTLASAVPSSIWTAFWIYVTAPPLGMLLAAELHRRRGRRVRCAKLHHDRVQRCIFRCGYREQGG
jgi:aquaporin Z